MSERSRTRKRRSISTIVGSFFFIILMLGTFTAVFSAIELQSDMLDTQRDVAINTVTKFQEKFRVVANVTQVGAATCSGSTTCWPLQVRVKNEGTSPVEIAAFWLINKTGFATPTPPAVRFEVDNRDAFVPAGVETNVAESQTLRLKPGTYDVKVVSTLGTTKIASLLIPSTFVKETDLSVKLFAVPPHIRPGGNVTLVMHVFNKGLNTLLNVKPGGDPILDPFVVKAFEQTSPTSFVDLEPLEDYIFTWNYKLIGAVNTVAIFKVNVTAVDSVTNSTLVTPYAQDKVLFLQPPQSFIQQPEISLIVPSPFGETTTDKGLWGVTVANPTDVAITVSRVIISITVPNNAQQESIIDRSGTPCPRTPITPTTASEWSCPQNNVIEWKDTANPEPVAGRGVKSFMAKYQPGAMGGTDDDPAYIISATIFSSFGTFSKGPVVSGSLNGNDGGIGNVYMTTDPANPLSDAKILGNMTDMTSGKVAVKFNVTLVELSTGTGTDERIASGARLIINIPSGFRNVQIPVNGLSKLSAPSCTLPCSAISDAATPPNTTVVEYSDASTQISVTTTEIIGDIAGGKEAATLQFTADAPSVTITSLYPLFIYAEGSTSGGFPVGAFAEIPVQVCAIGVANC